MNYLFGDSTPSDLTSNFLEFFRDALDFLVHALQSDERILEGKKRAQELHEKADVEIERLARFITLSLASVEAAEKDAGGPHDSPTAICSKQIRESIGRRQEATLTAIREKLASDIAQLEADEAATRNGCREALATLLRPHDPPDADAVARITLSGAGGYEAQRDVHASFGLDWTFLLAIPDGSIWNAPLRVERLCPQLEIRAPQLSGWISKEVKVKPQKIERYVVTEISHGDAATTFKIRSELGSELGFDFTVEGDRVKAVRRATSEDGSAGPFDVDAEDAPKLVELATKIAATIPDLTQQELRTASVKEIDFASLPGFIAFVEGFVAMMTPIVREIAERSLTPNELVIRRALGNDRREEIFVSKKTLREKYSVLPSPLRAVFAPLGLEGPTPSMRPPNVKQKIEEPSVRAELPKSEPPAPTSLPKVSPPPKKEKEAERLSSSELKTIPLDSIEAGPPPVPSSRPAPPPAPAASKAPSPPSSKTPSPPPSKVSPAAPPVRPVSNSSPEIIVTNVEEETPRNETLVAALKKIAVLSRNGRTEDAYRDYAALFSSPAFADFRPEDQRQALRLMVLAKSPPAVTETVKEAHRIALVRIAALVKALEDPADYELLGVTKLLFEDTKAASEAFTKGLALERERNPQSELCGKLMQRVSSL